MNRALRRAVAHHEAGHFVAAYFLGIADGVFEITIQPSACGAVLGNVDREGLDDEASQREIERAAIELFAGYAAEVRFDPRHLDMARRHAGSDDERAAELLAILGFEEPMRAALKSGLRANAASLIEEHWDAVTALARALLKQTTIDVYEATYIVAAAEGTTARKRLALYRASIVTREEMTLPMRAAERRRAAVRS